MGALDTGTVWARGLDILNTRIDPVSKAQTAMLGNSVTKEVTSPNAEVCQPSCWISRAPNPSDGKHSSQAVILKGSDHDVVIGASDRRGTDIFGSLRPGEFCAYAPGPNCEGQGRILGKDDGSVNLYTRVGNVSTGGGMVIQLDAMGDAIRALNSLGYGLIIDPTGIRLTVGKAGIFLDAATGAIQIIGTQTTQIDGASIVLGSVALPIVNSALKGPSGIAGSPSLKVLIQ